MLEARYKGPETINYKQADFSELKYIKITYKDAEGETCELKTEVNFLSDSYISLFVKKDKNEDETEEDTKDAIEICGEGGGSEQASKAYYDNYLKRLAEIKEAKKKIGINGEMDEYKKRLAKLMQEKEPPKEEKSQEIVLSGEELRLKEEIENKKFKVDCPQSVMLKFVIGDLLYVATAELANVQIKTTKVNFNIQAPAELKLQQRRRFYRIDLRRLCLLVATNKEGSSDIFIARSINLSAGGILINRLETMADGKFVTINPEKYEKYGMVIVLESNKVLKLSARYVREEEGKISQRYAFEFVDIEEEKTNYISKYIIGKQIEELNKKFNIKNKKLLQ